MKKALIKILSVILCISMINVPMFTINADGNLIEIIEDFSKYSSENDFVFDWGVNKTSTTAIPGFSDGSYNIIQTSSIPKNESGGNNGTFAPEIYGKFAYEKADAENKTVIKSKKLQGIYDVTIDLEYQALTSTNAYYYIFFGDLGDVTTLEDKQKGTAAKVRLQKTSIGVFNNNSSNTTTMSNGSHTISSDGNNTLKFTVDTNLNTVSVVVNGNTEKISEGSTMHDIDAVSGFVLKSMERFDVDSYVKIKKVTVKEVATDAGNATHSVLDNLPARLADDIDNVTEDITLTEATGLTWTSSDESVIKNDGKITRGSEDKEVKITATVDLENGGGVYTKEYTMIVPKAEEETPDVPDVPDVPDASLYKVVVDYTQYNDISEVTDISATLGSYADVTVTKGKGLEIMQKGSLPVVNGSSNTNKSPTIHLGFQGVVSEDKENNTQLRVSKFGGKLKIDVDIAVKNDSYTAPVDGVTVSTPYYEMYYGYSPSLGAETSVTFAQVYFRVRSANATIMNTTKAADNSMSPNTLYYEKYTDHKISTTVDTYSRDAVVNIDGSESKGKGQISSYFNGLTLVGMDRMQVGSYLNIKKVEISLLEANDDYNQVVAKLNSLPASLVADPDAVTENITLPEVADVKWTTSDSEICDEFGNINRWYNDRTVTLTATYGVGHTVMHKDYILNIKAMDNVASTEVASACGDEITNLITSGDMVAGKYNVDADGLKVVRNVENAGEYSVKYPLYGEEIPYSTDMYSSLSATGYSGIYDVSFSITPNVSDDKQVYVDISNDDTTGYGLEISKTGITLVCANGEKLAFVKEDTTGKTYNVTLRADTDACKVWILLDGVVKSSSMLYKADDYFISTLNVTLPEGCAEDDNVVINNISVTEFTENAIGTKTTLISAINKLSVSDITDNPENAESIKEFKASTDGYSIDWRSNSELIDIENKKIYHDTVERTIVVTAVISKDGIYAKKDFYLTIRAFKNQDEQLDYYISDLPQTITSQPSDDIRYDLNLPEIHNGLAILWQSSRPDIISNTGVINTSAIITEPTDVVLTANITINGSTVPKEYIYTVSPYAGEYVVYSSAELPASFTINGNENIKLTGNTVSVIKFTQNNAVNNEIVFKDSKGNVAIKVVVNRDEYYVVYGNGTTEKYPMPANTEKELKVVLLPDVSKAAVWDGTTKIADYVDTVKELTNLAGFTTIGDEFTVSSVKVTTDLYGMLGINLANVDYFAPFGKGVLKENATLITEKIIPCNLSWQSSDSSLITDDGVVTVPDVYKFVTMTLNMSVADNEAVKLSVPVTFAIACDRGKNMLAGSDVKATTMDKPGCPIVYATDNDINTVYGVSNTAKQPVITFDMDEVTYLNCIYVSENFDNYESGAKEYELSYSADGNEWKTLKTGTFAKPQDYLITFDTVKTRYIQLKISEADSKDVYFNEIEGYLFASSAELMELELELIDLGVESTVNSDLDLPATGKFGTAFIWESSNPNIIAADGTVTKPENGTTVKLTVTAVCDGKEYTREFALYVTGKKAAGGSSGGGGGAAGGAGGTCTSNVPGFTETKVPEQEVVDTTPEDVLIFADMTPTHWAYENVKKLKEIGIVNGDENNNFNPSANVTREQFLKMLVEALGMEVVYSSTSFDDVDANAWYAPYVSVGTNAGIINGITADAFGVGSEIKRQDMALMIVRVLNMKNIEVTAVGGIFTDDTAISDYVKDAVYTVRSAGIIEGYNNTFNPNNSLTRAEAATVIIKLLDLLK